VGPPGGHQGGGHRPGGGSSPGSGCVVRMTGVWKAGGGSTPIGAGSVSRETSTDPKMDGGCASPILRGDRDSPAAAVWVRYGRLGAVFAWSTIPAPAPVPDSVPRPAPSFVSVGTRRWPASFPPMPASGMQRTARAEYTHAHQFLADHTQGLFQGRGYR